MRLSKIIIIIYSISFYSTNCYLFSVIISIYNTGRYLDDSIGSLINQTIGFNKIQLILINDGSTDDSENICLKYKKLYPNNIIYVKLFHSGVSKARNIGLDYASGSYINFLDSDDKWDSKAFKIVSIFFKYYKRINIVGCRIKCFESSNNYHFLDYKFKRTRIVNVTKDYYYIHLSSSSSFFRRFYIKKKKFVEKIYLGEDIRFITNILINNPYIGFIREALYYYRRRKDSTSAVQNSEYNYKYYFWTIKYVQQYIIEESMKTYNKIISFIQYYIAYELLFRLQSKAYNYLNISDYNKYCKLIENLLKKIEDKYFLEQKIFPSYLLIFALSKKHDVDKRLDIKFENDSFIYSDYVMINLRNYKNIIIWKYIEINENILHLKGEDRFWMPRKNYYYYCEIESKKFYPNYYYHQEYDYFTMYGNLRKGRLVSFDINLNIQKKQKLFIYLMYKDFRIEIFTTLNTFIHIAPIENSYYRSGNYILKYNNYSLFIYPYNDNLLNSFEYLYSKELIRKQKDYISKIRKKIIKRREKKNKYKIWLINDRKDKAGDNGEYFFRYLNNKKPAGINFYFTINKNCTDYNRLKEFHNIINFNSSLYLNIFFKANKIITSVSESWVRNPFGIDGKYFCDLFNYKIIYLNNGIIKDEISKYINKLQTNFDLIITSSIKEYKSLLNYNYGYSKNNIALTGLPRFDNLKQLAKIKETKKIILIFPTWRMYIKGTIDLLTHESIKSKMFINTTYFNFYNNLINDQLLIDKMQNNGYKGIFCLHPNFKEQWIYFKKNEIFDIRKNCDIQEVMIKSSLLITDYSNLFFDFGFIRKPIIYAHFDYEEYRKNHYKQGFFDYKKNGFGPICHNIQSTIKTIIAQIDNNCKLKNIYLKRIKRFFYYYDQKNSYRTFVEINKMENQNRSLHLLRFFSGIILKYRKYN